MGSIAGPERLPSSSILDLWEHACLLYHHFEWQSAIDAFDNLAHFSASRGLKSLFNLNKGLIEARLGDLKRATRSFGRAIATDPTDPVSHFLLAIVHVELGDYATGCMHFEHTLDRLDVEILDCRPRGLAYSLAASDVRENASRTRSMIARADGGKHSCVPCLRLHTVPAEFICEAPIRTTSIIQADKPSVPEEAPSSNLTGELGESGVGLPTETAEVTREANSQLPEPSLEEGSNHTTPNELPEDGAALFGQDGPFADLPTLDPLPPTRSRRTLAPRDPQVRDESIRDLAHFLRHAGPSGNDTVTVDRKYMQQLLRGNGRPQSTIDDSSLAPSRPETARRSLTFTSRQDDLESLLDLYSRPTIRRRSLPQYGSVALGDVALNAGQEPSSGTDIPSRDPMDRLSPHGKSFARKPVRAITPGPAYPRTSTTTTELNDMYQDLDVATDTQKPSKRRRPALETAHMWLRKDLRPPWSKRMSKRTDNKPGSPPRTSTRSTSSSDNRVDSPLPSTIPSTEIFGIGISRRIIRSR